MSPGLVTSNAGDLHAEKTKQMPWAARLLGRQSTENSSRKDMNGTKRDSVRVQIANYNILRACRDLREETASLQGQKTGFRGPGELGLRRRENKKKKNLCSLAPTEWEEWQSPALRAPGGGDRLAPAAELCERMNEDPWEDSAFSAPRCPALLTRPRLGMASPGSPPGPAGRSSSLLPVWQWQRSREGMAGPSPSWAWFGEALSDRVSHLPVQGRRWRRAAPLTSAPLGELPHHAARARVAPRSRWLCSPGALHLMNGERASGR